VNGAKKLKTFYKASILLIALTISACTQNDESDISLLLDARNHAINEKDIATYADLVIDDYHQNGRTKDDILLQMFGLFKRFQTIQMQTHNRHTSIIDDTHALCEQTYTLKVMADIEWRSMVQQEQLQLTKQGEVWKISGGL